MANIPFLNNGTFSGTVSSTGLYVDTTGVIQLGDISGAGEGAVIQVDNVEGYTRVVGTLSLEGGVIFENDVEIISGENAVDWFDVTDFSLSAVDSILLTSDLITLDKYGSGNANLVATSWNASFNSVTATTFLGDLNGTINTATTGVTQTAGNNSTLIATTAYADAAAGAVPIGNYLPLAGGTMTGNIAMGNNDITGLSQLAFTDNLRFDDLGADNYLRLTYGDAGPGGLQIYDGDNTLQGYLYADGGGTSSFGLLSGAGQWGVKVVEGANTSLYHSGTQKLFTTTTGIDVTGTAQMDTGITEGIHYVGTAVEHWGDGGTGMSFPANDTLSLKTASSDRLYINSSGNVGIGTTSPRQKLDISGNIVSNAVYLNDSANNDRNVMFIDSSDNLLLATGTSAGYRSMLFYTENTERMRIDSAGNVGIGTTSPGYKLDVRSSLATIAMFDGTYGGIQGIQVQRNGGDNVRLTANYNGYGGGLESSDALRFSVNGANISSPSMYIETNGNVGIGTTSPQSGGGAASWLSLNGTASYSGGVVYTIGSVTKAYSYFESDYLKQQAQGGYGQKFIVDGTNTAMTILSGGNVGIGTTSPDYNLEIENASSPTIATKDTTNNVITKMFSANSQGFIGTESNHDLRVRTNNTDKITIQSGGNVGIGTTSPLSKLHAEGVVTIKGSGTATSGSLVIQDNYGITDHLGNIGWNRSAGGPYLAYGIKQDGSADWKSTFDNFSGMRSYMKLDNNEMQLAWAPAQQTTVDTVITGLLERFTFQLDSGTLKLNAYDGTNQTGTPTYLLGTDASGNVVKTNTVPGSAAGPYLPLAGGTLTGNLTISVPDGGSAPAMTNTLFMKGYEGRGIGMKIRDSANSATSPNNREWFVGSGYSNSGFNIGYSSTGSNSSYSAQSKFNITTGGVVTIPGNVGIGTTIPSEKLEVIGNIILDATDARLKIKGGVTGTNSGIDWTFNSNSTVYAKMELDYDTRASTGLLIDSGYPMTLDYSSGSFSVKKNGSSELTITGGNVGIGTTSPGYKLDVVGNAYISTTLQVHGNINFYDDLIGTSYKQGTTAVRNKRLKNIILESSTETNQSVVHPYFNNALGNFIAKGGTITFGNVTTPPSLGAQNSMFKPDQNFMSLAASNITASTWSMTLTSTNSGQMNFTYGCWIGVTFGSASFDPDSCKIEVNTNADGSGTWITALNSTVSDTGYFTYYASGGTGIKSIRFTMGQTSQGPRVCNIYAYNYAAAGMNEFFLSKAGGSVFGDIIPGTDYLSGGTYLPKLGGTGNRWNEAYIDKLADINNSFGTSGQVLSSNASGQLDWISGSSLPGGPYLPLSAGSSYPLTGNLFIEGASTPKINITDTTNNLEGRIRVANNYMYIEADDSDTVGSTRIVLKTDGVEALYLDKDQDAIFPNGNVGIGTTSPNQKLHVNGGTQLGDINATVNFGTVALKVVEGTVSTGPTLGSGVVGAQAVLYSNGLFGMYTGVSSNGDTWMQSQRNDANTAAYNMLLNPAGGNVGIGTTSPSFKLQVNGTPPANNGALINIRNSEATATNTSFGGIYFNSSPGNDFSIGKSNINTATTLSFRNGNDGASLMDITPSGNVGIGTTDPTNGKLVIDSTGFQASLETGTAGDGRLNIGHFSNGTFIGTYGDDGGAADLIRFGTHSGDERMRIQNNGNVGIGTTSPSYKLTVESDNSYGGILIEGDNAPGLSLLDHSSTSESKIYLQSTAQSSGNLRISADNNNTATTPSIEFRVGNSEKVRIDDSGNVGIGTTTPYGKLDVAGNIRLQSNNQMHFGGTSTIPYWTVGLDNTTNKNLVIGGVSYYTGDRDILLTPVNNGNVGIGNTSPGYKLDVTGAGRFTGTVHSNKLEYGGTSSTYLDWGINSITLATGNTSALSINSSQNVFIGAGSLTVNTSTVTATNFILSSDETLKDNIKEIDTKHVDVNWKNFELKSEPGVKRSGVIAQELEEKHPEFVRTDKDGLKSVAYIDLLITKIAELEARLEKAGI